MLKKTHIPNPKVLVYKDGLFVEKSSKPIAKIFVATIVLAFISCTYVPDVAIAPVSGAFVLFMSVLEMLVAALQAYVFTLLSALFIGQAVEEHDHH